MLPKWKLLKTGLTVHEHKALLEATSSSVVKASDSLSISQVLMRSKKGYHKIRTYRSEHDIVKQLVVKCN